MKLLTKHNRDHLLRNGHVRARFALEGRAEPDFLPVVKLFLPDSACTCSEARSWAGICAPRSPRVRTRSSPDSAEMSRVPGQFTQRALLHRAPLIAE